MIKVDLYNLPEAISTADQLIRYIENFSYYIENVKIEKVEKRKIYFSVYVPVWYRILFGFFLRKRIQEQLTPRMIIGVEFEFKLKWKNIF